MPLIKRKKKWHQAVWTTQAWGRAKIHSSLPVSFPARKKCHHAQQSDNDMGFGYLAFEIFISLYKLSLSFYLQVGSTTAIESMGYRSYQLIFFPFRFTINIHERIIWRVARMSSQVAVEVKMFCSQFKHIFSDKYSVDSYCVSNENMC